MIFPGENGFKWGERLRHRKSAEIYRTTCLDVFGIN